MTLLHEILEHNAEWTKERRRLSEPPPPKQPSRKIALFTCMDTRLVEFLEPALGIKRGDAKVIKNAGATLVDPNGGVVRSLVVAIYMLGCEEVFVIGHRDCGMSQIHESTLRLEMLKQGVPPEAIGRLEPSLGEWLGAFHDPIGNVGRVVGLLRDNPLIPKTVPLHGLMFDPASGRLEMLVNGYEKVAPPAAAQ